MTSPLPVADSNAGIRAHRRQWLLGPRPRLVGPGWRVVQATPGLFLSHDPDLRVVSANDGETHLIGVAVDAANGRPVRPDDLDGLRLPEAQERSDSWMGRWALLVGGTLVPDAGALMGLLFKPGARETWVSSSPALLQVVHDTTGGEERLFAMPPSTRFAQFECVLPGEVLDARTGVPRLEFREPFPPVAAPPEELELQVAALIVGGVAGFGAMARGPIAVGLSGGTDSRKNAAAAKRSGTEVQTFTFWLPRRIFADADRKVPPKVAARLGLPWRLVKPLRTKPEPARAAVWAEHTGQHGSPDAAPGKNHWVYTHGCLERLGYPAALVDGMCYELGCNYFHQPFLGLAPDYDAQDLQRRLGYVVRPHELARTDAYWASLRFAVQLDRRDLLFWTYKIAGDYANVYQELDLTVEAFPTANCRRLYRLLLSAPPAHRDGKHMLSRINRLLAPELADVPENPPDGRAKQLANLVRSAWRLHRNGLLWSAMRARRDRTKKP